MGFCTRCNQLIDEEHDSNIIEWNNREYHEKCFTCSSCKKSITNKTFYPKNNHLLLCKMCHEMTLDRCELCEKTINKGHIIIFQDKKYHDTCMRCAKCKGDIGGKVCFTKNTNGTFICRSCDENEHQTTNSLDKI